MPWPSPYSCTKKQTSTLRDDATQCIKWQSPHPTTAPLTTERSLNNHIFVAYMSWMKLDHSRGIAINNARKTLLLAGLAMSTLHCTQSNVLINNPTGFDLEIAVMRPHAADAT